MNRHGSLEGLAIWCEWDHNTNNLVFLMPIYIKRSEIFREKEKALVKYFIHKELFRVCTARQIIRDKDNLQILKLDLHDLAEETQDSSYIVRIMLSIHNKQFSKTEFEINHNSLGQLFNDSLGDVEMGAILDQEYVNNVNLIKSRENARIE
jgi:hypothetical protein